MSQAAFRAASQTILSEYAISLDIPLQLYPGRPRLLAPPSAFVDGINVTYNALTERTYQANLQVRCICLWGLFDSDDAVRQKDDFVDGLTLWTYSHSHQAGGNSLIWVAETQDLPDYVPEWIVPEKQKTYYATEVIFGGFESN